MNMRACVSCPPSALAAETRARGPCSPRERRSARALTGRGVAGRHHHHRRRRLRGGRREGRPRREDVAHLHRGAAPPPPPPRRCAHHPCRKPVHPPSEPDPLGNESGLPLRRDSRGSRASHGTRVAANSCPKLPLMVPESLPIGAPNCHGPDKRRHRWQAAARLWSCWRALCSPALPPLTTPRRRAAAVRAPPPPPPPPAL